MRCLCAFFWMVLLPVCSDSAEKAVSAKQADALDGPPFVTCKAWVVADGNTGEVLWGTNERSPRAMASTTKIMTAWLVLSLAAQEASILDEILTVSERADRTGGSSVDLKAGEKLAIKDLLYALLLRSGNDSAMALAEHFGPRFTPNNQSKPGDGLAHFVGEMNRRAAALGLKETKYVDPHGMGNNQTSARDLARLAWTCMKDERFRGYVSCREHRCAVLRGDGTSREVCWKNTSKLSASEGYVRVKAGNTTEAGYCLVSSGHRGDDQLYAVVLGATSNDALYVDTRNLYHWAWLKRGHR